MKLEELVDVKKLKKSLRRQCEDSLEGGCDFDLDDCNTCDHMESLIEGANVFAEELAVRQVIRFDPMNPKDVCPFEYVVGPDGETWTECALESGSFCDRPRHCILKEHCGSALVKVEEKR